MRSIRYNIRFKTGYLCLTALLAAVFIFCNQDYDNPVSSKYDGYYRCYVNWNGLDTDSVEILKSYSITVIDTGKDKYHQFEVITEPPILFKSELDQKKNIKLVFLEPFSGKLSVVATRPNLIKDSYRVNVSIISPYIISGDTVVGRNVPANVYIKRIDSKNIDTAMTLVWDISSVSFDTAPITDLFTLQYDDSDNVKVNATIYNKNGSYKLAPFTVRFQGEAPVIESAFLRDSLRMGEEPVIDVDFSDDDTGTIFFTVYATAHKQFLTSTPQSVTGNRTTIVCDVAVSDTAATSLSIVATDQNGLVSVPKIITDLNVTYIIPEVEFMSTSDTVFFKYGDNPRFIASGEADSFLWVIDNGALTKGTKENSLQTGSIMDTLWHTITLTGINHSFIEGNTATLVYKARITKYALEEVTPFPSEIRTGRWYSWEVRTVDALKREIGSDSVRYLWTYPQGCKDSLNEDNSSLYLFFEDSVKSFSVEVMAIVGNDSSSMDTTVLLIGQVKTRVFQPQCFFDYEKDSTLKLNDSVGFNVTVQSPDPDGKIDTVFYKVISPDTSIIEAMGADELWGYRFRDKGVHYLIAWAVDSYGVKSNFDTLKIGVTTDKPVFNPEILKMTVYTKDTVVLTASIDPHPHKISKYFWYLDSDTVIDSETDTNFIEKVFQDTGTYTIKVNCVNVVDDYVAKPLIITVTVCSNNPVIKNVIHPDTVFINDSCKFSVIAEDVGKNAGIVLYAYSFDRNNFYPMKESRFDTVYSTAGWKRIYFQVIDDLNLRSQPYPDSVLVRSAIPVIDSVNIEYSEDFLKVNDTFYVNDIFNLNVFASDTNGVVEKVFVSWDDDDIEMDSIIFSSPEKVLWAGFSHMFDTNSVGKRTLKVWAFDDDKQKSVVLNKEIYVFKGAPVIEGFSPKELWVNDSNTITLKSTDPNGVIIRLWVDWGSTGVWDNSSLLEGVSFPFFRDTTFGDKHIIFNTKVMDNDFLVTTKLCSILVKMGRPVISGENFGDSIQWVKATTTGLDTMFYIQKFVGVPIMIKATDDNGTIKEIYWDLDADGTINEVTNSPKWVNNSLQKNYPRQMRVWGKDDDSINAIPLTFVVFPDEPPPVPDVASEKLNNSEIKILWRNEDAKDGQGTKYAIVLGNSSTTCTDTLVDFNKGNSSHFTKNGEWYSYTFKPTDKGYNTTFSFLVIAKDDRNSISESMEGRGTTVLYP